MHSDYTIDNRQRTNTEREGFRRLNLLVGVPSKRLERPAKTGSGILKLFVQDTFSRQWSTRSHTMAKATRKKRKTKELVVASPECVSNPSISFYSTLNGSSEAPTPTLHHHAGESCHQR